MENIKLSFIVPVYNVEPYLCKCVDSLLAQDNDSYEIILVDDGSQDECPQICDQYSAVYNNIRVIHRENGGLSAARNAGVKMAKGEYVCFVDSDDYWEPNVLGGLMEQVEREKLDVLRFNYQNVKIVESRESRAESEYEVFSPNKAQKRDVDYSETVTDGETFLNERLGPMCYAVMFVIKRCLLVESQESRVKSQDCLFKEGIYFEDTEWTPRMLVRAKRVASTPMIVYNYFWRNGSITLPTDPKKRAKVIRDKIALLYGFKEQSKLVSNTMWFDWMTSFNTMTILGMLSQMPSSERKPYLQKLKSLQVFPLSIAKEKIKSHRLKIRIVNISPNLYCKMMNLIHR